MQEEKVVEFISAAHKDIEGWFFPLDQIAFFELFILLKHLGIDGDVCEVGVYRGKSLTLLSVLKNAGEKLYGFDLFVDDDENITKENLREFGSDDDVALIKGLTSELSRQKLENLVPSPLRFLHIDAGHEYFEVLEQLRLFTPLMRHQGIISMDDYQDREFPGIEAAVLDFSEQDRPRRFVPFLAGGNKLFLCSPTFAPTFQNFLLQRPNFKDKCRLSRVRDFNVLILQSKLPVPSAAIAAQLQADFPHWPDDMQGIDQKSEQYSQLRFGSGIRA